MAATTCSVAAMGSFITAVVLVATFLLVVIPTASAGGGATTAVAPEDAGKCDGTKDLYVNQTAGYLRSDGAKEYGVVVTNQAAVPVTGIHLMCGYKFRSLLPVDPAVLVQVDHGDCLLAGGRAIPPGGNVSFAYAGYVRYDMSVVAATCGERAA
ncbi:hypothetical protein ACP70R_002473 [Stipagrostis hirtigluma subsp. patula]